MYILQFLGWEENIVMLDFKKLHWNKMFIGMNKQVILAQSKRC